MKNIQDFKNRIKPGVLIATEVLKKNILGEWQILQSKPAREVATVQTNCFSLRIPGDAMETWSQWPRKDQFSVIDKDTITVDTGGILIKYSFIQ